MRPNEVKLIGFNSIAVFKRSNKTYFLRKYKIKEIVK